MDNKKMNNEKWLTPLQVIRGQCLNCQGNSSKRVKECEDRKCLSWVYRFGHNPKRKGIGGNPNLIKFKKLKIDETTRTCPKIKDTVQVGTENLTTPNKHNLSCKLIDKIRGSVSISESNSEVVIKIEKLKEE